MKEFSKETQEWIIKLVQKQRKVELNFISKAIDASIEDIIKNAVNMNLIVDGEFLISPESLVEKAQIRELTDEFVFCPKCGKKNVFSFGELESTNYYCAFCQAWLNYYWSEYKQDKVSLKTCEACQQQTFVQGKFCITCGSFQSDYEPPTGYKMVKTKEPFSKTIIILFLIPLGIATIGTFISFLICAGTPNSLESIWSEIFVGFLIFGIPSAIGFGLIGLGLYAIIMQARKMKKQVKLEA
ncbi:MAG: hypothetical protein FK732_11305 [Asgard group archaeon]|nr:hypothetical protein [Asgard group archaeon]